jgi:hypothetical protein
LSARCQVCMSPCGYVLSCQVLNIVASQGSSSNGAYLVLESPRAWLLGARVCAESMCEDKKDGADKW